MAKKKDTTGIPQHEIDALARALLPAIQQLFETEEGRKEFEDWKAARQQLNKKSEKISPSEDHPDSRLDEL